MGTDHKDYRVAHGIATELVGPMSDGLVRIENATVSGPSTDIRYQFKTINGPRAFVHRSHSGFYGIVNSEEGFQNLTRFLFGGVRIDGTLLIKELALPPEVEELRKQGKTINASYHIEAILRVRGKPWDLHRRVVSEESAIFRKYKDLFSTAGDKTPRSPVLFSAFLSARERVNLQRTSLGFSVDIRVLVPEYEVAGMLLLDKHYKGGYLYRNKVNCEVVSPETPTAQWRINYGYDSETPNDTSRTADAQSFADVQGQQDAFIFAIPVIQDTRPGISATLQLEARMWNVGEGMDSELAVSGARDTRGDR